MIRSVLFLLAYLSSSVSLAGQVAFLGDSLSTGGAAHEKIRFDIEKLTQVVMGEESVSPSQAYRDSLKQWSYSFDDFSAPVRLERSVREYQQPAFWLADELWTKFSAQYLDTEEYSWAYLLGRSLGYRPNDILIAARDGERMANGIRQVDRLLDHTEGKLPEKLFIFFSGNDLCGPSLDYVTSADDFSDSLQATLRYIRRNGEAAPGGTEVYIMSPLGVLQVFSSKAILGKKVPYYGKEKTCQEVHQASGPLSVQMQSQVKDEQQQAVAKLMGLMSGACSSLYAISRGDTQVQITLSKRLSEYRKSMEASVKEMNKMAGTRIQFNYLPGTQDILFEADEIANDCFHLSLKGHHKVAQRVKEQL